ncbi:MAG TPA: response regulator transcription factor, partial [Actinomycetota bacterium]
MNLLLVEDDRRFAHLLAQRLTDAGFSTTVAFTGPDGLRRASSDQCDLAIMDVLLPEMDGVAVTQTLRQRGCQIPILMLTAKDAVEDRVAGLRAGADDYLVKPFAFVELLARIEALGRRSGARSELRWGPVDMNIASHRVTVHGVPLDLTPKEFDLFECLLRGAGRVLTRSEIKEYVWGFTFDAP